MRIILSISSDIGTSLAKDWLNSGHQVAGTYRTWTSNCEELETLGATLVHCDFSSPNSVRAAGAELVKEFWEVIVMAAGDQNPIGLFAQVDFDDWSRSLEVNFIGMSRFLHMAIQEKSAHHMRSVIFFAGGGTNNATERYSGYTISKIASIKMCELLDFEIDNIKFSIVGPGWVKTKIHESTLNQKKLAGNNYERTRQMVHGGAMTQMSEVIDICNWLVSQPKAVVGGRNFSLVHDAWRSKEITEWLVEDSNRYKLRRFGNEINLVEKWVRGE